MRRLLITALIALSVALAVPPASAGGPTSVLITDPATGTATALYYSDALYAELEALLAEGKTVEGEPRGLRGGALNLTWLVHDVQPWRTQQLYPDADGGALVVSYGTEMTGSGGQVSWARIADEERLAALLDRIFRPSSAPAAAQIEPQPPQPSAVERTATETESAWYSLTGWRWILPGLVIGAGSALLVSGRRTRDSDPPLLLTDLEPGHEYSTQR